MKDNRHLYDKKYYKTSLGFQADPKRMEYFVDFIKRYNPKSVLDVGCGLGAVVNELNQRGIEALGIDFAPDLEKIWGDNLAFTIQDARRILYENKSFDLVFSSDFFEHIDEEDIDKVASEMKRVGRKVVTFVADAKGPINQRQRIRHVTHKTLNWWKKKLKGIEVFSSHIL
jgi:ubiquinone/menaquinone biosynthesis C-methylase UbiE